MFRIGLLCLVGGPVVATEGVLLRRLGGTRPAEAESAEQAREQEGERQVRATLLAAARELEPEALAAAQVRELISGLDLDADSRTFQDLFETEDWWGATRTRFPLNALVTSKETLAVLGASPREMADEPLVTQARRTGLASGVTVGNHRAFLAAAAKVTRNKRAEMSAVIVLGAPLQAKVIDRAVRALSPGAALGISDGHALLLFAARPDASAGARSALLASVGREAAHWRWVDDQHVVRPLALAPELWALAYLSVPRVAGGRGSWPVFLGGSTVFLLGLVLIGRAAWPRRLSDRPERVVIAGDDLSPGNGRHRVLGLPLVGGDPALPRREPPP